MNHISIKINQHICKKSSEGKCTTEKNYCNSKDRSCNTGKCRGTAHNICNSKYSFPKKIPVSFHD